MNPIDKYAEGRGLSREDAIVEVMCWPGTKVFGPEDAEVFWSAVDTLRELAGMAPGSPVPSGEAELRRLMGAA